jgi:dienelactone hydrolase
MAKITILFALVFAQFVKAEIHTEAVEYKQGNTLLQGFVTYDDKLAAKRPGVVIVHDWMGVGPFAKTRAEELAAMGYTAFVADIYGKDVKPKNTDDAGKTSGIYKTDRKLLRDRVTAAYQELGKHKTVDPKRMGVMGYCFGGMTALELARSGAKLNGVISFHGNLDTPAPADAKNITGELLILHGADDPYVPPAQVAAFEKEMKDAGVKYSITKYPGAVHAFTNPDAGSDKSKGSAYNAEATAKSTEAMKSFWNRVFKKF